MKVDFFLSDCTEPTRTDEKFGICDDQDGQKAYTDHTDNEKWGAIVRNENLKEVKFIAIDNCIIILREASNDKESTCDGMLTFEDTLYLVELKVQRSEWIKKSVEQLENTMKLLHDNHDLTKFRFKKAFACNRKHPHFITIDNERNKRFFQTYGFRMDVQAEIVVK